MNTNFPNKHQLFASSSSSSASCGWDNSKRQRCVISEKYGDQSVPVIGENISDESQKQTQYASSKDLLGSSPDTAIDSDATKKAEKGVETDDADSESNLFDPHDDYYDDNEEEEEEEEEEDNDEEYEFDNDIAENFNYNYNLASKFDDMDLPPGVEATVPWLQKVESEVPKSDKNIVMEDEIDVKYKSFKRFDTVDDYSDHYFAKDDNGMKKPPKNLMKRIQQDWRVLENDLPDKIFVRVYDERMDLLRAVIVGSAGTPYHDGLFFFDFQFPFNYPQVPPQAHYHSGGLRLNPNLYECGKVCLSLLGTWSGEGCETWDPEKSTMLQVLVSIQALVLNEKPYFNEPGYERSANTAHGEKLSLAYNETTFLYSCKTMMYSLRNPPKSFQDFIAGHFRKHGHTILVACRAYLDSAQVGTTIVENKAISADGSTRGCSWNFKHQLRKLFEDLLMEFTVKGADCKEFLKQKVKVGDATALPTERDC